jgi:poly(3-hydroxybutyrate) depolymerase
VAFPGAAQTAGGIDVKTFQRPYWLIPIVAAILVCSSLSCCLVAGRRRNPRVNLEEYEPMSIVHDGVERTAYVYVPAPCDSSVASPLVLALHGGGGTAEGMIKLTQAAKTAKMHFEPQDTETATQMDHQCL